MDLQFWVGMVSITVAIIICLTAVFVTQPLRMTTFSLYVYVIGFVLVGVVMVDTSPTNKAAETESISKSQNPVSTFCYNGTLHNIWKRHAAAQPSVAYLNGVPIKCEGAVQ